MRLQLKHQILAPEGPDQEKEDEGYIQEVDAPAQVPKDEDSDAESDEDGVRDDNAPKDDGMNREVGRTMDTPTATVDTAPTSRISNLGGCWEELEKM